MSGPLVKGYMTWRYGDNDTVIERHYAVFEDGRVFATEVLAPTIHFGKRTNGFQAAWVAALLPDNAEFIGNYPAPVVP